jgi:hypothetical protein
MRRRLMLRSSLVLALTMAALWIPSGAAATVAMPFNCRTDSTAFDCDTPLTSIPTVYKGWAHVSRNRNCGGIDRSYDPDFSAPRPAWRWTGTRWTAVSLDQATAIYVWPYATNWSWVWTQRTGWLALQDQYVVINPSYVCNFAYPLAQAAR